MKTRAQEKQQPWDAFLLRQAADLVRDGWLWPFGRIAAFLLRTHAALLEARA